MYSWKLINTSELPTISKEIVEEERASVETLQQLEITKCALNAKLAALVAELSFAITASPASLAGGEAGVEIADSLIASIQNEISQTEMELSAIKAQIEDESEHLRRIRQDKNEAKEEVYQRSSKLKTVEKMGSVEGHYQSTAQHILEKYKLAANQLDEAGHILQIRPNTSIHELKSHSHYKSKQNTEDVIHASTDTSAEYTPSKKLGRFKFIPKSSNVPTIRTVQRRKTSIHLKRSNSTEDVSFNADHISQSLSKTKQLKRKRSLIKIKKNNDSESKQFSLRNRQRAFLNVKKKSIHNNDSHSCSNNSQTILRVTPKRNFLIHGSSGDVIGRRKTIRNSMVPSSLNSRINDIINSSITDFGPTESIGTTSGLMKLLQRHSDLLERYRSLYSILCNTSSSPLELRQAETKMRIFKGYLLEAAVKDHLLKLGLDVEDKQQKHIGKDGYTKPDIIAKNNTDYPIAVFDVIIQPGEQLSAECKCGSSSYLKQQLKDHISNQLSGQMGHRFLISNSDVLNVKDFAYEICDQYLATLVVLDVSVQQIDKTLRGELL